MSRKFSSMRMASPDFAALFKTDPEPRPKRRPWPDGSVQPTGAAARDACPYKPGSVVWFDGQHGLVKALVTDVMSEQRLSDGDWNAKLRVAPLTRKGGWSRTWFYTYPGAIERAFDRANTRTAVFRVTALGRRKLEAAGIPPGTELEIKEAS